MQPSPLTTDQLKELANGLAQLQDFRLLFYVLIIIVFTLIAERWSAAAAMRKERAKMWEVVNQFSDAAKTYSDVGNNLVLELRVLRALASRVEANVGQK